MQTSLRLHWVPDIEKPYEAHNESTNECKSTDVNLWLGKRAEAEHLAANRVHSLSDMNAVNDIKRKVSGKKQLSEGPTHNAPLIIACTKRTSF